MATGPAVNCEPLKKLIREVPDFPRKGILFYDITTLLKDKLGFATLIDALSERYLQQDVDLVLGMEARGFIFAPAVASTSSTPGLFPYASRANCRRPRSGLNTNSNMAAACWRFTKTRSKKGRESSSSMICWRPEAQQRPPFRSPRCWVPRFAGWALWSSSISSIPARS